MDLAEFWHAFWEHRLTPFPKSSSPTSSSPTVNQAGIVKISAVDFAQQVLQNDPPWVDKNDEQPPSSKHSLVLFTSSMCGHCRRLLTLYNQLGRLVLQTLGWSSFLTLYHMDVSTDEVPVGSDGWNVTIRWVPDLVYLSPVTGNDDDDDVPTTATGKRKIVRYQEPDAYGDHVVGGVKNYLELVEWFLHVAVLEDSDIAELLSQVQHRLHELETS